MLEDQHIRFIANLANGKFVFMTLKVKSTTFWGEINFFRPLALRHWVPNGKFLILLDEIYTMQKTASRYDDK